MAKKNIHIVPSGNRWAVKKELTMQPISEHKTKSAADQKGRVQARKDKVELVIHGRNGQFQDTDSFGKDPCPPKDKKH